MAKRREQNQFARAGRLDLGVADKAELARVMQGQVAESEENSQSATLKSGAQIIEKRLSGGNPAQLPKDNPFATLATVNADHDTKHKTYDSDGH